MSENIFIPEVLEKTEPIKGAIEAIKKLSQSFTIYIITSRSAEMIKDVNRWLINYDLRKNITGIFSSSYRSKQDICLENHIVFLCDDDIRHIINSKIKTRVLFNTFDYKFRDDIVQLKRWEDIENFIYSNI